MLFVHLHYLRMRCLALLPIAPAIRIVLISLPAFES